jgi:1-acyl-sn-glycerol-3-phosphate acyltransferase
MPAPLWTAAAVAVLALVGLLARRLENNPRGDIESGLAFLLGRLYARVFHNLRVHGAEHIPPGRDPGPIVVVANHTAGLDPILIQAVCPFPIRWIMASDMRAPALEWFWRWQRIIFVSRADGASSLGLRSAIAHLRRGGVVGIFPEGGLERPSRHILPFHPGLGMLIRRTDARVLPVLVDDTPQVDPAWASLWKPSRSRVTFGPMLEVDRTQGPAEIAERVRGHFIAWTGWPVNDHPVQVELESGKTAGPYGAPKPSDDGRSAA